MVEDLIKQEWLLAVLCMYYSADRVDYLIAWGLCALIFSNFVVGWVLPRTVVMLVYFQIKMSLLKYSFSFCVVIMIDCSSFWTRSELRLEPGCDPSTMYHVGQVVKCRITSTVTASRRINLSFIIKPSRFASLYSLAFVYGYLSSLWTMWK